MDEQLKSNLTSSHHWLRLVFMVLFALILQVASLVMWALVAVQFLWALVTGDDNDKLRRFGHSLAKFIFDALRFLTYNTEQKPFPFSDWPELPPKREAVEDVGVVDPKAATGAGPNATAPGTTAAETEAVKETVEDAVDEARQDNSTDKTDRKPGPAQE
jgi:nitrogen fixation-related uncharacterized protein